MEERKDKIKDSSAKFFRKDDLADEDDIFVIGFVNSLFVLQFGELSSKEFSSTLEDEDLDFESFRTLNTMDGLLQRRLAPAEMQSATA